MSSSAGTAVLPRQAHMPIRPYLDGARFDPETIRIMGVAFEMAREALYLANRDDLANDVIANRIIDLAKAGERDANVLCEGALKSQEAT
jgi:hypothetical protein